MVTRLIPTLLLVLSLLFLGCGGNGDGPQLTNVSGTVTLDGEPLADASVEFAPIEVEQVSEGVGGSGGNAATDPSGNYTVRTGSQYGLQPGKFQVRIAKSTYNEDGQEEQQVPARYNVESELEVTSSRGEIVRWISS